MPKDTTSIVPHPHAHGQQPVVPLKRNQACRQCRKRKMKCDAQRPCRGCVRSHGTIVANLVKAGQPFPPVPECTYDGDYDEDGEVHLPPQVPHIGAPGNAIVQTDLGHHDHKEHHLGSPQEDSPTQQLRAAVAAASISPRVNQLSSSVSSTAPAFPSSIMSTSVGSGSGAHRSDSAGASLSPISTFSSGQMPGMDHSPELGHNHIPLFDAMPLGYSTDLPSPEILLHLVQTFFQCQIFANTLLHRSTFLSRLQLPPSHPQYPSTALLHAICADASLYGLQAGSIAPGGTSGFGAMHAGLCMAKSLEDASMGRRLLETVQAFIIMSWWQHANARWSELWISTGLTIRYCIPLGLSKSITFDDMFSGAVGGVSGHSTNWKVDVIMQPTTDAIEVELRRRAFWHAYMLDRVQGAATAWPMAIDDLDIGQELPLTQGSFDAGILPPDVQLQRLSSTGLLTSHPINATDSFVLYLKAGMLMSRVSNFNVRLRTRHGHLADLPQSPAFKTLESQIASFRLSFPKKFRDPFANGVDPILLMAHTIPLMATIILQEPHCSPSLDCQASTKCLEATRLVLDSVYRLSSTSFDFSHLTNVFTFFWTVGSKVLMRKYARVLEADEQAEAVYCRLAMLRQRLPHSIRNARITLELCEEVENRRSKCGHGARLLGSGGMAGAVSSQSNGHESMEEPPIPHSTDLSFEGLPFASGLSWTLPNGPNGLDSYGGIPNMDMVGLSSPGRQKLAGATQITSVRDTEPIELLSSDEERRSDQSDDGPEFPIPQVGSVLKPTYKPGKLPGEGGISMPEPHPYQPSKPPSHGPGAPFKPPTMLGGGGRVSEDANGEKFNIDVGGDDFKTNPDDAQRALKELVEGAMGASELDGVDMKDATVKGFREGITLMPHQIQGRAWMRERETGKKCGGILADDMGLGKTIQTLTRVVEGKPTEEDHDAGYTGGTLIICPVGLIAQWESEIKKMCLRVRAIPHHGPSRTKDSSVLGRADVVITSYQVVSSEHAAHLGGAASSAAQPKKKAAQSKSKKRIESDDSGLSSDSDVGSSLGKKPAGSKKAKPAALFGVKWWRIVLDEAQNIKNRTTKAALACCALRGRNKWCLTGTPIQNSVEELYSLFKFLGVRPLNDWDQFRTTIAQPVKQGRSTRAMKRLHVVLKAVMLRRTKDMTIDGAPLLNLPGRQVDTVVCEFDEDERAFYTALEQKTELTLNKFIRAGTVMNNYTSVLLLLLRLRQGKSAASRLIYLNALLACDHPSLVSKDFQRDVDAVESKPAKKDDSEDDELADLFQKMGVDKRITTCAICQTELPPDARSDEKHCDDCAEHLAAQSRRKSIATKSGLPPSSAKIRKIIELLDDIEERSGGEDKTILFSQFTTMLDLIEPFLKDARIGYSRLDGSMVPKDREVALDKIRNSSKTRVILISFKAGSTGLNLTACNNVILVDLWWNPALEDQAFDRAHRLGQTKDVNIYKLTIAETVEERILKLQDTKRDLAKAALSGDKLNNNRLGLDDIMNLFNKRSHEDSDED
ncbi:SNF2 family DNA-dependent ATPase [Ceratobasidium theobromae]|uniref:SNF2 family DNA-dependent ATPase n=1 Tax=Ceratobasidium theobromae TaxID=1582974 RepID=A0A5N5QD94_9AGAM|nr:SNF2 family DNA-dependent ATPase [Ceratobasidium theobromae]